MTVRSSSRLVRGAILASALALVAAACGSDDNKSDSPATTVAAATTTAASTATTEATATTGATETSGSTDATGGSTETTGGGASAGTAGCPAIDASLDKDGGTDAGRFVSDITCAGTKPLKAEGDPIVIGFQNPEGDQNGSFP